jgi:ribulose-phosphate 3-epimerase
MSARQLFGERHVAPSILSADFARLGAQVAEVMAAGARVIHVDVMDGHFVPPITMGALAVDAIAEQVHAAAAAVDVHLMVDRPERHVADFARAGADNITIHVEATPHVHYALHAIHAEGCGAGVALCPATPADCPAYVAATRASVVGELQAVFAGAVVALALAVVVVALWLRAGPALSASGAAEGTERVAGQGAG